MESYSRPYLRQIWTEFQISFSVTNLLLGLYLKRVATIFIKADIALHGIGNPISELRDITCHMGSHSVTCHPKQVNTPRLTSAMQAGSRFTYPGWMEG